MRKKLKIRWRELGGHGWIPDDKDLEYIAEITEIAYTKVKICRHLEITPTTLKRWIDTYPEIEDAIQEGRERSIQHIEDALYAIATSGKLNKVTLDACIYYLNTRGKWTRYQKQVDEEYDIRKVLKIKEIEDKSFEDKEVSVTLKLMRKSDSLNIRKDISNGVESST